MQPSRGSDGNLRDVFLPLSEKQFESENHSVAGIKQAAGHARRSDFLPWSKWCKSVCWTELWTWPHSTDPRGSACQQRDKMTQRASNVVYKTVHSKTDISRFKNSTSSRNVCNVVPFGQEGEGREVGGKARARRLPGRLSKDTGPTRTINPGHLGVESSR